jgi:hypothetical protein
MNSDFVHRQADGFVRRLATLTDDEAKTKADSTGAAADTARRAGTARGRRTEDPSDADDEADEDPPARFDDRAMIAAAYPLLYGRDVTEAEVEVGVAFLAEQRAAHLEEEVKKVADEAGDMAERRASLAAWVQYARALFSAAEFRFVD